MDTLKDSTLEELSLQHGLTVRAVHVCEGAGLAGLSDIRAFHKRHGGFWKLRNCGAKTVLELEVLLANAPRLPGVADQAPAKRLPENLAYQIYQAHVQRLSTEALHVLRGIVGGPDGYSGVAFFLRYGEHPPQLEGLRGPGRRELLRMSASLFVDLEQARQTFGRIVDGTHENDLYRWALDHSVSEAQMKDLFDEEGRMTLFRFMQHYLKSLDRRTPHRILIAYLESRGHLVAMTEIGERFDVTREYVRQVLVDIRLRTTRLCRTVADLPDVRDHYPELVTAEQVFMITPELLDRINAREGTHWSPLFALHIMQAIGEQDQIVGSWTTLLGRSHWTKDLDVQHPFLISRGTIGPMSLLLKEVARQYGMERVAPMELDLRAVSELVEPSLRLPLCEALKSFIEASFPSIRSMDGRCILPPNKTLFNEDRLLEVLESLDVPSHVSIIREKWNQRFPDHPVSIGGIRSLATDHKDLFMSIGRSSTYGLKRWQTERPGLRGGTTRSIIAELLNAADLPLQVEELEARVKCYRPDSDLKSILQNLKLAREFKIYPGCYVGLKNKVYEKIPEPALTVPGSLMRDPVLTRFIGQPRTQLSEFLASRCPAPPSQIEVAIDKAVAKGRLVIDAFGIIREVRPSGNGSAALTTALPPAA